MEYDIKKIDYITIYYKKGTEIIHREDGPAIYYDYGRKCWFYNGFRHREGEPAVEDTTFKEWYIHGDKHRIDGPAVEYDDGIYRYKEWWINAQRLSLEKEAILNKWWENKNGSL